MKNQRKELRNIGCNCNNKTKQNIHPRHEGEREYISHKKGVQGRKNPKDQNKDEVLLSATCLGGENPKKKVTLCH
jgi:hypothetical protein